MRLAASVLALLLASHGASAESTSVCYGRPGAGRLDYGVSLPLSGANFIPYTRLARALDRNYVHERVAGVIVAAYERLAREQPTLRFVYGETGHAEGGPIPPHRTHQNGLSVDFMVPVRDAHGTSVGLPTWPWNRYGYGRVEAATRRTVRERCGAPR